MKCPFDMCQEVGTYPFLLRGSIIGLFDACQLSCSIETSLDVYLVPHSYQAVAPCFCDLFFGDCSIFCCKCLRFEI